MGREGKGKREKAIVPQLERHRNANVERGISE
jgi:hypothetical protein